MWRWLLPDLFLVLCSIAGIGILGTLFFLVRLGFQFKSRADLFSSRTLWNPLNAVFVPSLLTKQGLRSRRLAFISASVFLSAMLLGVFFILAIKTMQSM